MNLTVLEHYPPTDGSTRNSVQEWNTIKHMQRAALLNARAKQSPGSIHKALSLGTQVKR